MNNIDEQFEPPEFLANHWQKRPLLIKGMFPAFEDPLDEHELAGLATEPKVDSRIVSLSENGEWQNISGPFNDFSEVCQGQWSLLVQGVDRHLSDVDDLIECFNFIPYWRMDDVMISYSVPGAGVGAHIDQYDVFLLQGKGQRRWQVAAPGEYTETQTDGLRQVTEFTPMIDVITNPGDVLYIPPGWPHKGQTIIDAMTYSIGFRAPDGEQLIAAMHDGLFSEPSLSPRYCDPSRTLTETPAKIKKSEMDGLKQLIIDTLINPETDMILARFLSEQDLHIEPYQTLELDEAQLRQIMPTGLTLCKTEGVRPIYTELQSATQFTFFIDGMQHDCPRELQPFVEPLLNNMLTTVQRDADAPYFDDFCKLVFALLVQGVYFIERY